MKKRQLFLGILLAGFFLCLLGAQEEQSEPDYTDETTILIADDQGAEIPDAPGATLTFGDFLRMILILGAVILVIYLFFRFLKRAGGPRFENPDLLQLHATLGMGSNRTLHLVEVGREFYLIGSAENSVNLVSKIEDKESVDQIRFNLTTEKPEPPKNFSDILSRLFQKGSDSLSMKKSLGQNKDFMKSQRDRLKNL